MYDGSNYRNILGAAELGREILVKKPAYEQEEYEITATGTSTTLSDGTPPTATGDITINGTLTIPAVDPASDTLIIHYEYPSHATLPKARAIDDLYFEKDDRYSGTDPRGEKKLRTRFCWWSGISYTFPISTVNNSTTVTVSDTSALIVGNNISGLGLAADSKILEILNGTTFRISQAATATGSVSGVISNGQLKGWAWADEILGLSDAAPTTPYAPVKRL